MKISKYLELNENAIKRKREKDVNKQYSKKS